MGISRRARRRAAEREALERSRLERPCPVCGEVIPLHWAIQMRQMPDGSLRAQHLYCKEES